MNQKTQLKRNGWMSPVAGGCGSEPFPGCELDISDGSVDTASPDPVKKAESPGCCCSVDDPDGVVVVLLETVSADPIAELWRCSWTSFDPPVEEVSLLLFLQERNNNNKERDQLDG